MVSSSLNASSANIICYKCKGTGHTRKVCPSQTTSRRVNFCGRPSQEREQQTINATASSAEKTVTTDTHSSVTSLECMIVNHIMDDNRGLVNVKKSVDSVLSSDENVEKQLYVASHDVYRDFVSLQYVHVSIDELNRWKTAVVSCV